MNKKKTDDDTASASMVCCVQEMVKLYFRKRLKLMSFFIEGGI